MAFEGSSMWKIRQKLGHDLIPAPTVDVIAVQKRDGKLLMVFNKDFNTWTFPGGYVEVGDTWRDSAARELREESGVFAESKDLIPIGSVSGTGFTLTYPNGDSNQCFGMVFLVKEWRDISNDLDESEISDKAYFSLEEIAKLKLAPTVEVVLGVYKGFVQNGTFQIAEV